MTHYPIYYVLIKSERLLVARLVEVEFGLTFYIQVKTRILNILTLFNNTVGFTYY